MILKTIHIQNFRTFADQTIDLDRYTCLVGPNGAGKSTVLTALNVFFRNTATASTNMVTLGREDFHHCDTTKPISITLTFDELSAEAKEDLRHYVRQGQLVVSAKAVWNNSTQSAEVRQFGSRLVMADFAPYFAAVDAGAKAAELAEIYEKLRLQFTDLPKATTGPARIAALSSYEESHPNLAELIEDTAQFFGFTKGTNLLSQHIQWVYIPAVKDASTEQDETGKTALGQLLERTIRAKVDFKTPISALRADLEEKYRELIRQESAILSDLESSIEKRLKQWANPSAKLQLGWHFDPNKSLVVNEPIARAAIGEGAFVGEVARLGHGLQRSFLVSVLHELASTVVQGGPTLLLGFEEPELYQHPPQAQHMSSELEHLCKREHNSQVIVSTHSPYFVSTQGFENVRVVRKDRHTNASRVAATTYAKLEHRLSEALGSSPDLPSVTMTTIEQIMQPSQRELYFTRVAVLVEGMEDIAFIGTHLQVSGRWADFRRLGCHFVLAIGKTNLSRPLAIASELQIPAFVIFDADRNKSNKEDQIKDNSCLLRLCGLAEFDPLPECTLWGSNHTVWPTCIFDAVRDDVTEREWQAAEQRVRQARGYLGGVKQKNNMLIAGVLDDLSQKGVRSGVLDKLCDSILTFAEAEHA